MLRYTRGVVPRRPVRPMNDDGRVYPRTRFWILQYEPSSIQRSEFGRSFDAPPGPNTARGFEVGFCAVQGTYPARWFCGSSVLSVQNFTTLKIFAPCEPCMFRAKSIALKWPSKNKPPVHFGIPLPAL